MRFISANQALEQGRAIFAVRGPIDRPTSQGSNRLIQQGGAKLVMGCEDILEELSSLPDFPRLPVLGTARAPELVAPAHVPAADDDPEPPEVPGEMLPYRSR